MKEKKPINFVIGYEQCKKDSIEIILEKFKMWQEEEIDDTEQLINEIILGIKNGKN
jgi:hypothetical protein